MLPAGTVDVYRALDDPGKEVFVEQFVNAQVEPPNYPFVGLQNSELIEAKLIVGGDLATHTYDWTEFEIDTVT